MKARAPSIAGGLLVALGLGFWACAPAPTTGLGSGDSADLAGARPSGNRVFASLRGPVPLSGDPHNSTGTTPGLAVIQVTQGGRNGEVVAIVPLTNLLTNPLQVGSQAPDPHGIKVRERR